MIETYRIKSKIKIDEKYNCTYKTIDAILPELIGIMYTWDIKFEILSISAYRDEVMINIHYDEKDKENIKQISDFSTVVAHDLRRHYDFITLKGVL